MPIRELSERPVIPRLGKIRLGEKAVNPRGIEYPVDTPYFVVPPEVAEVYGEKPVELRIVFLTDDEEAIASQYFRAYNATNGRVCRGDGFWADASLDADELKRRGGDLTAPLPVDVWAHGATRGRQATQQVVRQDIKCLGAGYEGQPPCPMYTEGRCSERMFLQFAIVGVKGIGVYQMDTGSIISISRINGTIKMIKALTGGRIAGISLTLRRVQAEVTPDGKRKKVWTVELSADDLKLSDMLKAVSLGPAQALLPLPDESEVYAPLDEDEDFVPFPGQEQPVDEEQPPDDAPVQPIPIASNRCPFCGGPLVVGEGKAGCSLCGAQVERPPAKQHERQQEEWT